MGEVARLLSSGACVQLYCDVPRALLPKKATKGDTSSQHIWSRGRTIRFLFPQLLMRNQTLLDGIEVVRVALSQD